MFCMPLEWQKKYFSVNKTTSLGHVFEFIGNTIVVRNNQWKVIGEGVKGNKLYKLRCNTKLNTTKNAKHAAIF
jgi:hypothetical protein